MALSASPCLTKALGAQVDKRFARGFDTATGSAGKGFRQNRYGLAPLSAAGCSAALCAKERCLHEKGLAV